MLLKNTYDILRENLYKPFLFFIPKGVIPKKVIDEQNFNHPKFEPYFNNLIIIEKDGFSKELKKENPFKYLLGKPSQLNESLFALMDVKQQLNKKEFDMYLEKYLIDLNFYNHVSSWMFGNMDHLEIQPTDEQQKGLEFQSNCLEFHKKEVEDTFIKIKKTSNYIKESISNKKIIVPEQFLSKKFKEVQEDRKSLRSNNKYITEKEAEVFLLQTVFGIKAQN